MFYPMGCLTLPFRFVVGMFITGSSGFVSWILRIGHNGRKPFTGLRKCLIRSYYNFCCYYLAAQHFIRLRYKVQEEYDYSYYLGPDYLKTQKLPAQTSTLVCNHQTWFDNLVLVGSPWHPAFGVKIEAKSVYVLASILAGNRSYYIDRGASPEQRQKTVNDIINLQKKVESDPDEPQLLIYPEGTMSNGCFIMPFKRGAFAGMRPVIPLTMKYTSSEKMRIQWDVLDFLPHTILTHSYGTYSCTVSALPPFMPNDYLLETHRDKVKEGAEDWEIYAWAVRDVMAKSGGFETIEVELRDKVNYKKFMVGKSDRLEFGDKIFEAPPMRKHK
jgi:1-acyl-sn-glycerol-3-phosphate acyltransferase